MKLLSKDETEVIGSWISENNKIKADEICDRIEWLVENHLTKLAVSEDGWDALYKDPIDSRFWMHRYPKSHLLGGGPPALTCISEAAAKERFNENS